MAVAADIALAVAPAGGRFGGVLVGFDDLGASLVAFTARELDALLVDGRGVAERHVIAVEHVLDLEFPVAVIRIAMGAHVEGEFPIRSAIDQIVDTALHRADLVLEAYAARGHAGEYETPVLRHAGDGRQIEIAHAEAGCRALRNGHPDQLAIGVKCPAVVAAGQTRRVTAALVGDLGAAMRAAIVKDMNSAVAMARHDDGLAAKLAGDEVTGIGHLAGMADEQPSAAEQPIHFKLENIRISIDPAMDTPGLDQRGNLFGIARMSHRHASMGGWLQSR